MALLKLLAAILGICSLVSAYSATFENLNVLQIVDLANVYLRQSIDLKVVNTGTEPASAYIFVIPEDRASKLAKMVARDVNDNVLEITSTKYPVSGYAAYEIKLNSPLPPNEEFSFGMFMAYSTSQPPYPAEDLQDNSQMLLYTGSKTYPSIYRTRIQHLQFNSMTSKCEIIEEDGSTTPATVDSMGLVTFGPLEKVEPLKNLPLKLRYENPLPQAEVQKLDRTLWVSHWGGSISFDEKYDVKNVGTKLKRSFDRMKFGRHQKGFNLNSAAINGLRIALPETHREEYYVDLIGNVSTSGIHKNYLELSPRYPIMGGWFYNFTVGWAADLSEFVSKVGSGHYVMKVPLIGGPETMAYREVINRIVLPEGAKVTEVLSDTPYKNSVSSLTYSYLDLYGRPTVVLDYDNIISDQRDQNIYVTYRYSLFIALRKPLSYTVLLFMAGVSLKLLVTVSSW